MDIAALTPADMSRLSAWTLIGLASYGETYSTMPADLGPGLLGFAKENKGDVLPLVDRVLKHLAS